MMGLDNGIIIKPQENLLETGLTNHFEVPYEGCKHFEVCYWRKCWGLRNYIVEYLEYEYNSDTDNFEWELSDKDIYQIIQIIKSWQNKKKWNECGNSIWTYKEIKGNLQQSVENLSYLLAKKEDFPYIKVVFYDSY